MSDSQTEEIWWMGFRSVWLIVAKALCYLGTILVVDDLVRGAMK